MNRSVDLITFIMGKPRTVIYMLDTSKGGILYTPGKKYEKQLSRKNKYRQQMMKVT